MSHRAKFKVQSFTLARILIPMSFQDETKARRILDHWRDPSEAHIRSDLQRASNEASGSKDKRIRSHLITGENSIQGCAFSPSAHCKFFHSLSISARSILASSQLLGRVERL